MVLFYKCVYLEASSLVTSKQIEKKTQYRYKPRHHLGQQNRPPCAPVFFGELPSQSHIPIIYSWNVPLIYQIIYLTWRPVLFDSVLPLPVRMVRVWRHKMFHRFEWSRRHLAGCQRALSEAARWRWPRFHPQRVSNNIFTSFNFMGVIWICFSVLYVTITWTCKNIGLLMKWEHNYVLFRLFDASNCCCIFGKFIIHL